MMVEKSKDIDPAVVDEMRGVAMTISDALPTTHGFVLLTFDFGKRGRMNYLSNAKREDMIAAMEELLKNMKTEAASEHH